LESGDLAPLSKARPGAPIWQVDEPGLVDQSGVGPPHAKVQATR